MIASVTSFGDIINPIIESALELAEIGTMTFSLILGLIATFKLSFRLSNQPVIALFLIILPVVFMSWRIDTAFENNVTHFMNIFIFWFSVPLIISSLFKIFSKNIFNEIH